MSETILCQVELTRLLPVARLVDGALVDDTKDDYYFKFVGFDYSVEYDYLSDEIVQFDHNNAVIESEISPSQRCKFYLLLIDKITSGKVQYYNGVEGEGYTFTPDQSEIDIILKRLNRLMQSTIEGESNVTT